MIDAIIRKIIKRVNAWLESKPTGKVVIEINVNQGGVRGKPKISITDEL